MPVSNIIQPSFAGGEYAPSLYSRVDIQRYAIGLRTCRNFIIHPHGGASNRAGTYYVASTKNSSKLAVIKRFVFSQTQAYILEFGDQYIRFYTDGGQIQSGGSPYEISSPYLEADLRDLRIESSGDVITITHGSYQTQELSRLSDTSWTLSDYEPDDGPFMLENASSTTLTCSATTGTSLTLTASAATFDADHVGALFKLKHFVEGQSISQAFTATGASSSISCFTTWRLVTHGTWGGTFDLEKSTDGGSTWTRVRTFSSAATINHSAFDTEDPELNEEPFLLRINVTAYSSGSINIDLNCDSFYQEGIVRVTGYTSSTSVTVDVIQDLAATTATSSWCEGSWSDYRGWPKVARYFQDRLVLAGTETEPQTTWPSKIANYSSHSRNQISLLDTDAMSLNLPTRELNSINGLIALKRLIAFTSASEWSIGSVSGATFTPTTASQEVEGYNGSSGVDPIVINNQAIFVESNGKVVRNIGYQLNADGFVGDELNILAKHLFEDYTILEMAYQQTPNRICWCLRSDGKLLGLTYMPEQEVIAWHWHDTDGTVDSIAVIPADGYDELWLAVNRDNGRYIERMAPRVNSDDPVDWFFVDSGVTDNNPLTISGATQANPCVLTVTSHGLSNGDLVDIRSVGGMTELNNNRYEIANVTTHTFSLKNADTSADIDSTSFGAYTSGGEAREAKTTFTGLTHLEGQTVSVLANGEVRDQATVSSGQITLADPASIVHIGLPYNSDLETLNVEIQSREGSIQGRKIKIGEVTFRFVRSRGGWIGPDSSSLYEAFAPSAVASGSVASLTTGDIPKVLGGGYEDGGRVFYRQPDPLPVTIGAIIPKVSVGG